MVIVRISSGIGNQMFQYALGRALSAAIGAPLKLDVLSFECFRARRFELDAYRVCAELAPSSLVEAYNTRLRRNSLEKLAAVWKRRAGPLEYIKERQFHFDPRVAEVRRPNVYLAGYWQTEKYFSAVAEELRGEFTLRNPPSASASRLARRIDGSTGVSVHFRRLDYAKKHSSWRLHRVLGLDYYERAFALMQRREPGATFFVFSDEPAWVRANFRPEADVEYVDPAPERPASEDMWLMSRCKHHIIANSTFSWWGAWLGSDPDKLIVAPRRWFGNRSLDARDVVPERWYRL